jgi:hypothetical protein
MIKPLKNPICTNCEKVIPIFCGHDDFDLSEIGVCFDCGRMYITVHNKFTSLYGTRTFVYDPIGLK